MILTHVAVGTLSLALRLPLALLQRLAGLVQVLKLRRGRLTRARISIFQDLDRHGILTDVEGTHLRMEDLQELGLTWLRRVSVCAAFLAEGFSFQQGGQGMIAA